MDKLNTTERSKNMSAIRSQNTKPELLIRQWLFAQGYRYRLNVKYIPGHPDLFLRKYNAAVFVNGCFWHRHSNCKYAYTPKSNMEFWSKKFDDNIRRDNEVRKLLENQKIKHLVIWECTIKKMMKDAEYRYEKIENIERFFVNKDLYLAL